MDTDPESVLSALSFIGSVSSTVSDAVDSAGPYIDWLSDNWILLTLTFEILGSVVAIKTGHWRKGICWLVAALVTIWITLPRSAS